MRKTLLGVVVAAVFCAVAQDMSLAEARAKIGDAISDPAVMTATIKGLSAADQKSFLADVNEAIGKMPGSVENKAATFLNANRAALTGASKGNLSALLAEVFATVAPEALPVICENFAADLFNRSANPSVTFTDEQYTNLVVQTMQKIAERNASVDNAGPRDTFAAIMFVRASNGSPAGLSEVLVDLLPEDSREIAKNEWMPAALSAEKSYDGILGACNAGTQPNPEVVLRIAGPQSLEALLVDLATGSLSMTGVKDNIADRGGIGSEIDNGLSRVPFFYNKKVFNTGAGTVGNHRPIANGSTDHPVVLPGGVPVGPDGRPIGPGGVPILPDEPQPYQNQY